MIYHKNFSLLLQYMHKAKPTHKYIKMSHRRPYNVIHFIYFHQVVDKNMVPHRRQKRPSRSYVLLMYR